jgi:hypothetical protein
MCRLYGKSQAFNFYLKTLYYMYKYYVIQIFGHFFWKCNIYTEHIIQLFRGMSNLGFDISIENILFGNASFENDKNSKLFLLVQKYIVNSKRFVH